MDYKYYGFLSFFVTCWSLPTPPQQGSSLPVNFESDATLGSFNGLQDVVENALSNSINAKVVTISPNFPNSGRKYAILEQKNLESLPIQIDNKYGSLQSFVSGVYNPKPIVDTIEEYEKYGNDGDQHRKVGTAIVNGYEAFSNIVNAAVELPFVAIRQFGKKISTSLNSVGSKIVGLS